MESARSVIGPPRKSLRPLEVAVRLSREDKPREGGIEVMAKKAKKAVKKTKKATKKR